MSDPKWATDIANKKSFFSYEERFGGNSLFATGSSTTSTSAVGAKRETIYGHTNRNHIFTPGTFTGAISFVKNLLSLDAVLGVLWGGKNETITNSDSNKIIGSKKRVRVGYRFGNWTNPIGKALSELWWKEERVTIGDRVDTVKGDIQTVIVNGEEKKIFNNTDNSTWRKMILKSLGFPRQEWVGVTYSSTNAATGYSFRTDKGYEVATEQIISFSLGLSYLHIFKENEMNKFAINTDNYVLMCDENRESISGTKTIRSNIVTVSCDQGLYLGVKKTGIKVNDGSVLIQGQTELGSPTTKFIYDQVEDDEDEQRALELERQQEQERLERERLEREAEQERLQLMEELPQEYL